MSISKKVTKGANFRNMVTQTLEDFIRRFPHTIDRNAYMIRKIDRGFSSYYVFGIEPAPNKSVNSRTFLVPQEVYIKIGSPEQSVSVPVSLILETTGYKLRKQ